MTPQEAHQRIRRYDARLAAFVRVFDRPLASLDAHGPTFAIKDLFDVRGVPTGGGSRTPLDAAPAAHATAVERLIEAGWQAVGKTHTVELAYGSWGTNRAVGAPWNPWAAAVHRAPGGSSSGSAVAVAAGLCDAALGSDTGGSVRIPAALCGVVGLKPSRGLVSLKGVHPLSPSLDTVGTLARSVAVAARMLAAVSGPDGEAADRAAFDGEAAIAQDVSGARIAALPLEALGELDPQVARLYLAAVQTMRDLGMRIEVTRPPEALDASFAPNGLMMAIEGWRMWGARIAAHADEMDPWIVQRFRVGEAFSDAHLAAAHARRAQQQAAFHRWLAPFDALLSPTCPIAAPPIAEVDEAASPLSRLTRAANYLDLPAISVPCGLTDDGLPVGLQILAPPRQEATVVALGAAFEGISGWKSRTPDLTGFEA